MSKVKIMFMKRIFAFFATVVLCGSVWSQNVLTVVHATSDDGFVNVRTQPSSKAPVVEKVFAQMHGLGNGVLRGKQGAWSKVSVGNVTGWAYTKYLGTQDWYMGDGETILIANKTTTPIYMDNYSDEDEAVFTTVKKGTIIADQYEKNDQYYILITGHDYLFIRLEDADEVRKSGKNAPKH